MIPSAPAQGFAKKDYLVALLLASLALAGYVRTLAPDVLYSDSAEFQCLAYTLGITHSTGYPVYLFLGRLIGFLPLGNPAWRISLLSAVCAAITVGGVYLLARSFTRSQVGAALGAVALAISYTFWSQAVIAEVYTPGMAFLVIIMLLLLHWQQEPAKRNRFLLAAALLAGMGFGVHASVWLVAPPAILLVVWTLVWQRASKPEWGRSLSAGLIGALCGLAIFLAAFFISDWLNSPTSFMRTTLEPSRDFWNLAPADFNSPIKRLEMTVVSAQWGDSLFPSEDFSFIKELGKFGDRLATLEFSPLLLFIALVGLGVLLATRPASGAFFLLAFIFSAFIVLNYQVGDKYVFYLSLYIPLTVAVGAGIGFMLDRFQRYIDTVPGAPGNLRLLTLLPVLFFATLVIQPTAAIRWKALQSGVANFVSEDYPYPLKNLKEPRFIAQTRLAGLPDNAVFVLDWRALFTTAYLAHVEKGLTNTLFIEALPRGNDGRVAATLIAQLKGYLEQGRPVYSDDKYPGLEDNFRILPASGDLYRITLKK